MTQFGNPETLFGSAGLAKMMAAMREKYFGPEEHDITVEEFDAARTGDFLSLYRCERCERKCMTTTILVMQPDHSLRKFVEFGDRLDGNLPEGVMHRWHYTDHPLSTIIEVGGAAGMIRDDPEGTLYGSQLTEEIRWLASYSVESTEMNYAPPVPGGVVSRMVSFAFGSALSPGSEHSGLYAAERLRSDHLAQQILLDRDSALRALGSITESDSNKKTIFPITLTRDEQSALAAWIVRSNHEEAPDDHEFVLGEMAVGPEWDEIRSLAEQESNA